MRKLQWYNPDVEGSWTSTPLGPYDEVYVIPELRQSLEEVIIELTEYHVQGVDEESWTRNGIPYRLATRAPHRKTGVLVDA